MKKHFYRFMLVALTALAYTACEDVPEPYDLPGKGTSVIGEETELEGGTGDGTLENPFNAIAATNAANKLENNEVSQQGYYIKGKVVSIATDKNGVELNFDQGTFGNATFYISDDGTRTNQFYCYRVLYLGNKKWEKGAGDVLKPGDDVIVYAKITMYNSTPETAANEGFVYSLNGVNKGGEPTPPTPAADPTGKGTQDDPYNVSAVLKYIATLGSDVESDKDIYIKGKVSKITNPYAADNFGNATFYISDDGNTSNEFYCYRTLYLGNTKYTNGKTQIEVGDEVIVCGKVVNYKGNTPETVQNKSYLYSLNGVTDGGGDTPQPSGQPKGTGTLEDPYNATAANAFASALAADAKSDKDIYIKGKIIDIEDKNQFNTQYGNCTFYISDDGTDSGDKFYVFRTLYLGNVKYTSGDLPKKGDEVIICGKVTNYKGNTPETVANESYIYSLNGKTEGGGGDTPGPQPGGDAKVVTVAEFNAAEVSNDIWYQLTGTVKNLKDGDQYGNFDLEDETGSVYVYGLLDKKGGEKKKFQDLVAAKGINEGCKLTIIGNRGEYNGKIEVMNAYFVSIEGGGDPNPGGGGDNPGGGGQAAKEGTNGDFESWTGDVPDNWKTASTAGNATLSKSTDAHGGSFSCKVAGNTSANKRLGYKEMELSAGTYKVTFYAKALSENGSVNPGIVPIGSDGKAGTYAYSGYVDNISTKDWQKVEATIDVSSAGTYCFVVMNQKKSTAVDILIDDFTVVSGSNTIIK
jgi:uncharacterized protein YdeI (BOF family)